MFRLIKQIFVTLVSFSESLATKCVSLNNESYVTSSAMIDFWTFWT